MDIDEKIYYKIDADLVKKGKYCMFCGDTKNELEMGYLMCDACFSDLEEGREIHED